MNVWIRDRYAGTSAGRARRTYDPATGFVPFAHRPRAVSVEECMAMGVEGWEYVKKRHDTRLLAERLEPALAEAVAG